MGCEVVGITYVSFVICTVVLNNCVQNSVIVVGGAFMFACVLWFSLSRLVFGGNTLRVWVG